MTKKHGRTVLGPVFTPSASNSDAETSVREVASVLDREVDLSAADARRLAWIGRDNRTHPRQERRRIFELVSQDGRSLVSVEAEE